MIVYSENITDRLIYVLQYVFEQRLGINFNLETDIDRFNADVGLKLNYTAESIPNVFQIIPHGLVFEKEINQKKPEVAYSHKALYLYSNEKGDLKFDIFSAIFWLLSRYEEFQKFSSDEHGRYPAKESLAYKHEFLKRPIVDEWILEFKTILKTFYPDIKISTEDFKVIPTIDVDSPWCYRNKGFRRNFGGIVRDALKQNYKDIPERLKVLIKIKKDSHYQFYWIKALFAELKLSPLFFVLVGKFGKYDKTVNTNTKTFQEFIDELMDMGEVNIHPSYKASTSGNILQAEISTLKELVSGNVLNSRQHFLKIKLPEYYEMLVQAGISNDYSLGYADCIGFRAGTSKPFNYYNLNKEQTEDLRIHPFSIMDVTLNQYLNLNADKALEACKEIIENTKAVKGNFVTLWHNESLSEEKEWKGWQDMYVNMLHLALD